MIAHQTLTQLRTLKLEGMAHAFEEQLTLPATTSLPFEDRFALLVEREAAHRDSTRMTRLLKKARLKYAQACLEDLDTRASRGLDQRLIASLAHGEWVERAHTVLVLGPTGVGKTWLACALAQKACRMGKSALYARLPRLLMLAKIDVLVLDDFALQPLEPHGRDDLLELIDDRAERRATVLTAQLPVEHWHGWIGEQTIADAILDRLLHHAHRLTLKGESLRRTTKESKTKTHS